MVSFFGFLIIENLLSSLTNSQFRSLDGANQLLNHCQHRISTVFHAVTAPATSFSMRLQAGSPGAVSVFSTSISATDSVDGDEVVEVKCPLSVDSAVSSKDADELSAIVNAAGFVSDYCKMW